MERHLVAVFHEVHEAEEAFHELLTIVPRESISFIHKQRPFGEESVDVSMDHPLNGILTGGAIGGVGGGLVGMTSLLFPGVGVLLAAGPLYGAIAGMTSGGIIGGLADLGINQYEAEDIESHLKKGSVIVTVETNTGQAQSVMDILKRHNPAYLSEEPISEDDYH